jgi:hypothetical protein
MILIILYILLFNLIISLNLYGQDYLWLESYDSSQSIVNRIDVPDGFSRVRVESGSFGKWLRYLPLKKEGAKIYIYDGSTKSNQSFHRAIIDIDIGDSDLQQCADAFMRLRAEYLYSISKYDSIAFNYTSGDRSTFRNWINGLRPNVNGNNVEWVETSLIDSSYANFKNYLDKIFTYAGTYSLSKELIKRDRLTDIKIGDVFVQGGFPGHLVFVVDIAISKSTKERIFLLAQGFTPAQDFYILKNPKNKKLSPWYSCNDGNIIQTPEWKFYSSELMRLND